MMLEIRERLRALVYPSVGLLALLALWQAVASSGVMPTYLLPDPVRVFRAIVTGFADGTLTHHLAATLQATLTGYVIGAAIAIFLAAIVAESRIAERFLLLHLFALQSIPKVSIAPLIFLWVGFGVGGKIVLVALICFFPIFANALSGFKAWNRDLVNLMRAAGASRFHIFMQVKMPSAASHIFAGLEVAVTFALIGCVVMEFVGATKGMGFLIQDASNTFSLALTFAAVIVLGITGILGNMAIRGIRSRVLFWERGQGNEGKKG